MNRETIINELAEVSDSRFFCKKANISEYLGISLKTVNEYVYGVPSVKGWLYHIPEVADAIMSLVQESDGKEECIE